MSIDPVVAIPDIALRSERSKEAAVRSECIRAQSHHIEPNSGTDPNADSAAVRTQTKTAETSQDEVQVQRDGQNQIVIKYLDGWGKVLLQVPNSQILALQQAIERGLEEQEQSRVKGDSRTGNGAGGIGHEH